MPTFRNPALEEFVIRIRDELVLAQVMIVRRERGYELRHVNDRATSADKLRPIQLHQLRALAQFTATGAFRPLKSAPTLQIGWRALAANDEELEMALNQLYPGAIADWFAVQSSQPPVTNYREFTGRQTGMYRITTKLTDAQVAPIIRVCCDKNSCLKRRLWTIGRLETDVAPEKSLIPCLEPCAILLESARKAVRVEQAENQKSENGNQ